MSAPLTLSVGRDYAAGYSTRYEYCLFRGETLVARAGNFKSTAAARREGIKAAKGLAA